MRASIRGSRFNMLSNSDDVTELYQGLDNNMLQFGKMNIDVNSSFNDKKTVEGSIMGV